MRSIHLFIYIFAALLLFSCNSQQNNTENTTAAPVPEDPLANAIIYEVNVRQYSPEGTFEAFRTHLPRLKEMGVDILWLMPIHPIGVKNRKGSLGSYYSVQNYKAVNPEYGTMDNLRALVKEAHSMGMMVILDWVANHSAWDNPWLESHPDFYKQNESGELLSPFDWTDVVALNYENPEMQDSMISALRFWLEAADIDGYRCDVAGMVPLDFWEKARISLEEIKPTFMLAEDEDNAALLNTAFDMNYAWRFHFLLDRISKGEEKAGAVWNYFAWNDTTYPADKYRMTFVSNHDENSWKGYLEERMGAAARAMTVLSWTVPGMPLIYSGEEAGLNKRLRFFDKDTISWDNTQLRGFYTRLADLRTNNPALWGGAYGGSVQALPSEMNENIIAFTREKDGNKVTAIFNLSAVPQTIRLKEGAFSQDTKEYFSGQIIESGASEIPLDAWAYHVYVESSSTK